ncbi:MAG: hypothetical protein M3203_04100, partial [Actinomycetota bacterium]|nr:hypothetical protein [Actinomycetota bacterium]
MDDRDLDLEHEEMEGSLPPDVLTVAPMADGDDAGPPVEPLLLETADREDGETSAPDDAEAMALPWSASSDDSAAGEEDWASNLGGTLFEPGDPDGGAPADDAGLPELTLPENLFEAGRREAPEGADATVGHVDDPSATDAAADVGAPPPQLDSIELLDEEPSDEVSSGTDQWEAGLRGPMFSTGDGDGPSDGDAVPPPPAMTLPQELFDLPQTGNAPADDGDPATDAADADALPSPPAPGPRPGRLAMLQGGRLVGQVGDHKRVRLAAAGLAASLLLGVFATVRPDRDDSSQVESAQRGPTVSTVARPFPASPPMLFPNALGETGA